MSAQSKKRLKKRHFKKTAPFFLVVASIVSLSLFGAYKIISRNIASAFSPSSYDLSTKGIYSVLYIPDPSLEIESVKLGKLFLIVINPDKNTAFVMQFAKDTKLDAPGKFGMESVATIFSLGERTSGRGLEGGFDYLAKSLEFGLGLKIDKFLYTRGAGESVLTKALSSGSFKDVSPLKLLLSPKGDVTTDFSLAEFYSFLSTLKASDPSVTSFENSEAFDPKIRAFTYNSPISLENKTIAVLNGSQLSGLAGFGGRVAENAGARVIEVSNASLLYDQSVLVLDEPDSLTAGYLTRYFNFAKIMSKEDFIGFAEPSIDRADITIILGLDIANEL